MPKQIPDAQILDAAIAVILERGYHGATTRQIAAAAGINEVTLFRRFDTKAELLRQALKREASRFAAAASARSDELEATLLTVVEQYLESMRRVGRLVPIILSEASRDPELLEVLAAPQQMVLSVAGALARYQKEGLLVEEPPLEAMAALLGPLLVRSLVEQLPIAHELPPLAAAEHVHKYLVGRRRTGSG